MTRSRVGALRGSALVAGSLVLLALVCGQARGQGLPDDIQRELNQNLAEQARLQALRARHQQLIQARTAGAQNKAAAAPASSAAGPAPGQPGHDPNNYSYQQVSPPIQYSYYQPYGDLAKPQQAGQQAAPEQQNAKPINIDLNNLNLDDLPNLPAPQAQTAASRADQSQPGQQPHLTPSFTGAGGLPVLQPVAAANQSPDTFAPTGRAPLPPQAQQGPPLTEADFKDITGGENYGAPGGSDFGIGAPGAGAGSEAGAEPRQDGGGGNEDAQLREFGMPDAGGQQGAGRAQQRAGDNPMQAMGLGNDFGSFNPMASGGGGGRRRSGGGGGGDFDPFGGGGAGGMPFGGGDFSGLSPMGGGGGGGGGQRRRQPAAGEDFDFASQPSSRSQGGASGAPGSLQSLLGTTFPGLGGGTGGNMGLDSLARGNGQRVDDGAGRAQRADDGALDIADLGERADGFANADLGGFEQPNPQNDQDYNYAAAAETQPVSVPYPDGGPQFVGSLWALTQPQSLTQTRYNPMIDKGTYQDYPAYKSGGNQFNAVRVVVDKTPRAQSAGPGRYARPDPSQLAPEYRELGARMDYAQPPAASLYGLTGAELANNNLGAASSGEAAGEADDFL